MERVYKGMKKYNSIIYLITNSNDFDILPIQEWEGCIGLSIVMSVIEGIEPDRVKLASHLGIHASDNSFNKAYDRLKINGIFSSWYNVKSDKVLQGQAHENMYRSQSEIELNAWCILAGIAGGFIGIKD